MVFHSLTKQCLGKRVSSRDTGQFSNPSFTIYYPSALSKLPMLFNLRFLVSKTRINVLTCEKNLGDPV